MTYAINPIVRINNVNYSAQAINGVTLNNGRTSVDEQPRAGYATINLVTPDNTYANIEINQYVEVRVDNSSGQDVILWGGWISDVETKLSNFGSVGWLNEQRITAVGSLTKLNRRLVGAGGYPKEFDGDRVSDIIFETAGTTWATYTPATDTWADIDPLISWASSDLLIGTIDTPGDFELTSYSDGADSGLALAQSAAQSGLGILYEAPDGKINYDDYTSRTDDVALNGFTTLDNDAILTDDISSVSRLADLTNSIEIAYKNNQTETGTDSNSVAIYGTLASKLETQLENLADAAVRVQYYLDTRAFPRAKLQNITVALHLDTLLNVDRDALLPMRVSKPIRVEGLPASIYFQTFLGFVEGYTWRINRNELFLTLTVSEYSFSQLEMNWLQVPPNLRWQDVSASLQWQNGTVVG